MKVEHTNKKASKQSLCMAKIPKKQKLGQKGGRQLQYKAGEGRG